MPDLLQKLVSFLEAPSWTDAKAVVQECPELLTRAADKLVENIILAARQLGDVESVQVLCERRALLESCRRHGVEATFQEKLLDAPQASLPMMQGIRAFLGSDSPMTVIAVLRQYPELFDIEADAILAKLMWRAQQAGDNETVVQLAAARGGLAELRQRGPNALDELETEAQQAQRVISLLRNHPLFPLAAAVESGDLAFSEALDQVATLKVDRAAIEAMDDYASDLMQDYPPRAAILAELNYAAARLWGDALIRAHAASTLAGTRFHLGDAKGAVTLYQEAIPVLRDMGDKTAEMRATGNLGNAYLALGEIEQAIGVVKRTLAISKALGDRDAEARASGQIGLCSYQLGQVGQAIQHFHQAIAIHRQMGARLDEGKGLGNLGMAYHRLGQIDEAIAHYKMALDIHREFGHRTGEAHLLGNLGVAYDQVGQTKRAIELYQEALQVNRELGDRRAASDRLSNLGTAYSALGQDGRAVNYFQEALSICQQIGDRQGVSSELNNLGSICLRQGQVERALEYYQKALSISREIGDRHGEALRLKNLGNAYQTLGQIEQAMECYRQGLAISRQTGVREVEANIIGDKGTLHYRLGHTEEAMNHFQQALAINREVGDRRSEAVSLNWLNLIYCYLGQPNRAREYVQQALAISRELGHRWSEGNYLGNLGMAYLKMGEIDQAILCCQQALELHRATGNRGGEGDVLGNLGLAYDYQRQIEQAVECYEKSLAIRQEIGDRCAEATVWCNLGNAQRSLGQVQQALDCYEKALAINREVGYLEGSWRILVALGRLYAANLYDYERASDYYDAAIAEVEKRRSGLMTDAVRRQFLWEALPLYEEGILAAIQAGKRERALEILDQSKTRFLADLLIRRDALPPNVPDELRQAYKEAVDAFQAQQGAYQLASTYGGDSPEKPERIEDPDQQLRAIRQQQRAGLAHLQFARERMEEARRRLDEVVACVRSYAPDLALVYSGEPLLFAQVQSLVSTDARTALIEFAVTSQGTIAFVVRGQETLRQEDVICAEGLTRETLDRIIDRTDWPVTLDRVTRDLWELLFAPVHQRLQALGITRVILIPHLGLHLLPLHALHHRVNGERRYLLDDYEVSYAPSCLVLRRCQERAKNKWTKDSFFAVANPTGDLRFAEYEVKVIASLFRRDKTLVLWQDEGREEAAISNATRYEFVHFACHGDFDPRHPRNPALILADTRLTLGDILARVNLPHVYAVVMSGCGTGMTDSRDDPADEFIGLPFGFLYAGAPTVIGSLWAVDDEATALLMERLYKNILSGRVSNARALNEAQTWLRDLRWEDLERYYDEKKIPSEKRRSRTKVDRITRGKRQKPEEYRPFSHPFYWAAFALSGV